VVDSFGNVYFGSMDKSLYCLDPSGSFSPVRVRTCCDYECVRKG
jgi:hypothetical protein